MATALSIMSRYHFRHLRPGENQDSFEFTGPGVVIIACEQPSTRNGEVIFSMLSALEAQDAMAIAKSSLTQKWACDGYVFAMLASIQNRAERLAAIAALAPMCTGGA